jgi:hypothetical protein
MRGAWRIIASWPAQADNIGARRRATDMLTAFILFVLALMGNAAQAIYASKLRRELRRAGKEIESWKLAAAHWESQAHQW